VVELLLDDGGRIQGVGAQTPQGYVKLYGKAVILACGGFEGNAAMRASYLGQGWDRVKNRGVPFNTGDGLRMAWEIGAQPFGHFSGCHARPLDMRGPPHTLRSDPANHTRYPFPWGLLINVKGQRFIDESVDRPGYTNGDSGQAIVRQPQGIAFQILDQKTAHLVQQYVKPSVAKADSLELLATRLDIEPATFVQTIQEFNKACPPASPINHSQPDGRAAHGLAIPKSHWALPIDTPPFYVYGISCGITFTYGGLRINSEAQVISNWQTPIPGLYACGEIAGGFWYVNYASGAGMTQGATFGRIAGQNAARAIR
jgi:tricarballylate dehydrogenase